jgi:hypothetical protein
MLALTFTILLSPVEDIHMYRPTKVVLLCEVIDMYRLIKVGSPIEGSHMYRLVKVG